MPNDLLQAERVLEQARAAGARRLAVVFDEEIYGRELAGEVVARARRDGPEPVTTEEYRGRVEDIPDIAASLAKARPDAVVYAGVAGPGTGRLLAATDMRIPGVPVLTTSGVLARDQAVAIPAAPATVRAVTPIRPAAELGPEGRRVLARIRAAEGPALARPDAIYGYEALRLVLDAIAGAGADRRGVIRNALRSRKRRSPLGEYGIKATGEVDTHEFALWSLRDGRFEFERMIE
ncbi:MAG: ABC transporter substrate-binding protein [Thermoleophilaceae bacterium]|nr:ABC transporter substrate-binding protein [Thermoleophilaceae bacterium]